ncbi:f-box domain-containing protein [Zymoseptoria brevis]|uniref:F-box domain-containing protein n=1 Tax=Zymoseptoria brevis TaxID=1047168 RepID=A0A0F4GX71_9PEZI|nr:f-box domain-containing protein [Zymoseptoria brevis]
MALESPAHQGIFNLPNEILLNIFGLFRTDKLVAFAPTCRQFHSIILRLLHSRMQAATALDGHTLYLECYPPFAKWTTSKLFCAYLGTDGLQGLTDELQQSDGRIGHSKRMGELFCRFRPSNKEPDWTNIRRPHPAGDIPGTRTYMSQDQMAAETAKLLDRQTAVTTTITVDAHDLFSQLCTVGYLARREPLRGILSSIQDVCDGTIRVWRDWLSRQCETKRWTDGEAIIVHHDSRESRGAAQATAGYIDPRKDPSILWINTVREQVGIKFRVKEQTWRREPPVAFGSEAEMPVSYRVEMEEVLVRTSHLLLKMEEAREQSLNYGGKAIIFGSYIQE